MPTRRAAARSPTATCSSSPVRAASTLRSCGSPPPRAELGDAQDVGDALVPTVGPQLVPSTIEDTVAQLRRSLDVPAPSVPAVVADAGDRAHSAPRTQPRTNPPEPAQSDVARRTDRSVRRGPVAGRRVDLVSVGHHAARSRRADRRVQGARPAPRAEPLPSTDWDADDIFGAAEPTSRCRRPTRSMTPTHSPSTNGRHSSRTTTRTLSTSPTPNPCSSRCHRMRDSRPDECGRRAADRRRDARRVVQLTLGLVAQQRSAVDAGRNRIRVLDDDDWNYEPDRTSRANRSSTATAGSLRHRRRTGTRRGSTRRRRSRPRTPIRTAFDVHEDDEWTTRRRRAGRAPSTRSSRSTRPRKPRCPRSSIHAFAGAPAESAPGSWAHAARPASNEHRLLHRLGRAGGRRSRFHRFGGIGMGSAHASSRDRDRAPSSRTSSKRRPRPRHETMAAPWSLAH